MTDANLILLLGGTSETAPLATVLAEAGYKLLVSTATDNRLDVGQHQNICRIEGRLSEIAMAEMIKERGICLLVDATHPFATEVSATASAAAEQSGVPYLRFLRQAEQYDYSKIINVSSHEAAAERAFEVGGTVLLTTGSRNLKPYVKVARQTEAEVVARVLPHHESAKACEEAGLKPEEVIAARGPFSEQDTYQLIQQHEATVLVTKDSGKAGGVPEKIEAARKACAVVVMIGRPDDSGYGTAEQMLAAVNQLLAG